MPITHQFINPFPDEPAFAGTKPSDWNAEHTLGLAGDTQIQFNNAGSLENTRLSYSNPGGQVILSTGQVEGGESGEGVLFSLGDGVNDDSGGPFSLDAGSAPGAGDGGNIDMSGGDSDSGQAGKITFIGGSSDSGFGGDLEFRPGFGGSGNGKVLFFTPGDAFELELDLSQLSSNREMTVPDKDGTIAFLDDIPSPVPGGSDTQIQFNDGGVLGGVSYFTFDKINSILSLGIEGNLGTLKAPDAVATDFNGGSLMLASGNGNGTANGGDTTIQAGSAQTEGNGGNITLQPGALAGGGVNGQVYVLGDLAFPADANGVILKDRNDGTNYRLYIDSGVQLIEAV